MNMQELEKADYVLAFTGEGSEVKFAAGGLAGLADAIMGAMDPGCDFTPAGDEEIKAERDSWLEDLQNPDQWSTDEDGRPFRFSCDIGEISHLDVYADYSMFVNRLMAEKYKLTVEVDNLKYEFNELRRAMS